MRQAIASRFLVILLVLTLISCVSVPAWAVDDASTNKYNVVIVLDASGSMLDTDAEEYRFEAISQFINLLTTEGNNVGAVVFADDVSSSKMISVNSQEKKDKIIELFQSVPAEGWTNTGAALEKAISMLKDEGDPNLPSVIVFLSDGNTRLGTEEGIELSLEKKANAIQEARESGTSIYSVCLNANYEADVTEMQQMADATGGAFEEVNSADDLPRVFNMFYSMIYGTSSITLLDDVFPADGVLETTFEVPGIGVEEVNILVYGNAISEKLIRPDGGVSNASIISSKTFSIIKEDNIVPGLWTLHTEGIPGDQIKINMVYNTNLTVDADANYTEGFINPADPITVTAKLRAGSTVANTSEQYRGYSADLVVMNAYNDVLYQYPMDEVGGRFEITKNFEEGVYKYYVLVNGNYLEKASSVLGPINVTNDEPTELKKNNTSPYPVENPVGYTVNIWPFFGAELEIDMATLAKDDQDAVLRYRIESSSFIEGTDYSVDGDIIRMNHFSLKKGGYTISATDTLGLSCEVEVIVVTHNIGLIALIAIGVAALIVLGTLGYIAYRNWGLAFMGAITAENLVTREERTISSGQLGRGQLRLSSLAIGNVGFDSRCYFQATGKKYIMFVSRKPVYTDGSLSSKKKVKLQSGIDVVIYPVAPGDELYGDQPGISVRFDSDFDADTLY